MVILIICQPHYSNILRICGINPVHTRKRLSVAVRCVTISGTGGTDNVNAGSLRCGGALKRTGADCVDPLSANRMHEMQFAGVQHQARCLFCSRDPQATV